MPVLLQGLLGVVKLLLGVPELVATLHYLNGFDFFFKCCVVNLVYISLLDVSYLYILIFYMYLSLKCEPSNFLKYM